MLCRDTGNAAEASASTKTRLILSVVDWFRPGRSDGTPKAQDSDDHRLCEPSKQGGTLAAAIVHLAEGRSGFRHRFGRGFLLPAGI